jgi:hypothetical protein
MDKLLTDEEMARLESCKNETEWNAACDAIKAERDGRYPSDWFPRVNRSGMMHRIAESWTKSP